MEKDFEKPVKRMFSESLELSEDWGERFTEFWDLPEDFEFELE